MIEDLPFRRQLLTVQNKYTEYNFKWKFFFLRINISWPHNGMFFHQIFENWSFEVPL